MTELQRYTDSAGNSDKVQNKDCLYSEIVFSPPLYSATRQGTLLFALVRLPSFHFPPSSLLFLLFPAAFQCFPVPCPLVHFSPSRFFSYIRLFCLRPPFNPLLHPFALSPSSSLSRSPFKPPHQQTLPCPHFYNCSPSLGSQLPTHKHFPTPFITRHQPTFRFSFSWLSTSHSQPFSYPFYHPTPTHLSLLLLLAVTLPRSQTVFFPPYSTPTQQADAEGHAAEPAQVPRLLQGGDQRGAGQVHLR